MNKSRVKLLLETGINMSTAIAEKTGQGGTLARSQAGYIELQNSKAGRALIEAFCPKAKNPTLNVDYSMVQEGVDSIALRFMDGKTKLSGMSLSHTPTGKVNYSLNIVDSGNKVENLRANGFYDPTQPLFEGSNWGVGFEHREGYTNGHFDSTGFSADISAKDEYVMSFLNHLSLTNIAKCLKSFFEKDKVFSITKLT